MGGVNSGDPVLIFHEEFAGASSKSLAIVVLEIFVSESDGGRTLVAYSTAHASQLPIQMYDAGSLTWVPVPVSCENGDPLLWGPRVPIFI